MPINYDPQTSYRGDAYAFQGIQNLGIGIGDALKTWQKKQEEARQEQANVQASDFVVKHALSNNLISPQDYNTYVTGDAKAKLAIAGQIKETIATDYIAKSQPAQIANLQAETALRQANANTLIPAQAANIAAETKVRQNAGQPVMITGSDGVARLAGFSTAGGGIDTLPAQLMKRDLPPGQLAPLKENGKLIGYQVTQPDGKIDVHTIANDPTAALAALIGGGGGSTFSTGGGGTANSGGPVHVKSVEEARALPPGTQFYDTNGILRVR